MKRQNEVIGIGSRIIVVLLIGVLFAVTLTAAGNTDQTVSLRIEGASGCLYYANETISNESSLKQLLESVNLKASLNMVGLDTNYITEIGGIKSGSFGGWDGWLYIVNGVSPSESISDYILKDGDSIVLFYGDPYGVGFQYPEIELDDKGISFFSYDTEYDSSYNPIVKKNPVIGATVTICDNEGKSFEYLTDSDGRIYVDDSLLDFGTYSYKVEKYAENGMPLALRSAPDASYRIEQPPATYDLSIVYLLFAVGASFVYIVHIKLNKSR